MGGYAVLVQGELPQRELLARFRKDETSILIGSVSFCEGVDVPGEGLTQVIVDRIPFPHPGDPLVRARNELEEGKGFVRVTLPNARMFLRQAVGRLIYNLFGLWIEKANDVQVLNNNITGKRNYDSAKRGNGVELYNTKGARIIGNEISFVLGFAPWARILGPFPPKPS